MKIINLTASRLQTQLSSVLGLMALTLIALPMGVFAQESEQNLDSATTSEEVVESVVETLPAHYDRYKREELPQSNKTFDDFVVGPGRFALDIAPGESKTVLLNISNRLGSKRLFRLTTEDLTTDTDGSSAIQLLGDEVGPYTIKDYISVEYNSFYIENNTRAVVPVTVSLPANAEPGGFYGSILTEVMPEVRDDADVEVAPTTAVVNRIGTLFYVKTPGDIERSGSLLDVVTIPNKAFYLEGPIDMGIVYENTGSVHLNPYGNVSITNLLGEPVGQVELSPWFVLPGSVKTREISWNREFLMGRYTVTADIERGYDDLVDTQTLVFWVFPWKLLSMVFAGVFIFFLILRFLLRNFEFKRR